MRKLLIAISGLAVLVTSGFVLSTAANEGAHGTFLQEDDPAVPSPDFQNWRGRMLDRYTAFKEELGLTEEQSEQLENLRSEHMKEMIEQQARLKIAYMELAELMKDKGNDAAVLQKHEELAALRNIAAGSSIKHRLAVRAIFTDEQWQKVGKLWRFGQFQSYRGFGRGSHMHRQFPGGFGRGRRNMVRPPFGGFGRFVEPPSESPLN